MFNLFNTKAKEIIKSYEGSACVTFDILSKLPVGETIEMKPSDVGAITTTRLKMPDDNLTFMVFTRKGEVWKYHCHDCNEEIVVYKGVIKEDVQGNRASRGETMYIPAFTKHQVVAIEDTVFYVEFENPRNKE